MVLEFDCTRQVTMEAESIYGIPVVNGGDKEKKQLKHYIEAILKCREKGEKAELDMYGCCLEFENSGVWMITAQKFSKCLKYLKIRASTYEDYKLAVHYLALDGIKAVSLPAANAIIGVFRPQLEEGEDVREPMTELHQACAIRLGGFKAERGHWGTRAVAVVKEEAAKLGIEVAPTPGHTRVREHRLLLRNMEAIAECSCKNKACRAREIAKQTLTLIGRRKLV